MSPRRRDRTQDCGRGEARTRLRQARLYLEVAQLVTTDEPGEEATVATGNAVLAGIAAADAICCEVAGQRYRGDDHRGAVDHLEQVTGDGDLAATLRDLVDLQDAGHHGLRDVQLSRARSAVRKAAQLVEEAARRVRA